MRACPICDGKDKTLIFKQDFHNEDLTPVKSYDVVVCNRCGFAFADNIPSQEKFSQYYKVMSKYEFNYHDYEVSDEYVKYFKKIARFIVPNINSGHDCILDVGCSTGALLNEFRKMGYSNLLGIDPSGSCVQATKKLYDINAIESNIEEYNSKEKFDLITLSAILEHIVDFKVIFERITNLLSENGLLFVGVPDLERFGEMIFAPFQQFSIEHINYFSRVSLSNLLKKNGFDVIEIKQDQHTLNMSTDPELLCIAKKGTKNEIERDDVSEHSIRDYVSKCTEIDRKLREKIREKLSGKEKIIVWGVGTHTQRLIGSGLPVDQIEYFVDSNERYKGRKLKGRTIKQPKSIKEELPILISSQSYQEEITGQIRKELKLNNEIITLY